MTCTCGHDADSQHDGACRECACPGATDDPTPVETLLNGRWRLWLPPHRAYRPQWSRPEGWEKERLDDMRSRLGPGDVVYDAGSEEADFAGLFATWVGPSGGVVLAEPNPRVWPNARLIWDANGLPDPLACVVGFLGDSDRPAPAWTAEHVGDTGTVWPACAHGPVIHDHGFLVSIQRPEVPVVTIDAIATRTGRPPSAISVDVEGDELAVMVGAAEVLDTFRPTVWISEHPAFARDVFGYDITDLHDLMAGHGYVRTHLTTDHEVQTRYEFAG